MKIFYTIVVIAVIAFVGAVVGFNLNQPEQPISSVAYNSEYHATTTLGSALVPVIKTGVGTLGSVIQTITGTAPLTIYDATTTNANLRTITATTSLPVLAYFGASPTVGTYTFDEVFYNGLIAVWGTGTISTTTITWR